MGGAADFSLKIWADVAGVGVGVDFRLLTIKYLRNILVLPVMLNFLLLFLQARNAALPPANCPPYMGGAAGARLANGKPVTARGHVKHIKAHYIF